MCLNISNEHKKVPNLAQNYLYSKKITKLFIQDDLDRFYQSFLKKTHPFTIQCQLLGFEHVLIPPASPTYNSHVERTHRIDKQELWSKKKYSSLHSMKKDLKKYVFFFNFKRPTKSKNWRPPVQFAKDTFGLNSTKLYYRV